MRLLLTALLILGAAPLTAQENPSAEITDPDMLKAMRDAKESNLSNAMAKSVSETATSANHLAALMLAAEAGVRAAVSDMRRLLGPTPAGPEHPGSLEEASDDLHLSSQMLAQKAKAFRGYAEAASLQLPKPDAEKLITQRAGYPSRDRGRDLRKAKSMLKNAVDKTGAVGLETSHSILAGSAKSFLGELRSAAGILTRIRNEIREKKKARPELSVATKRLDAYVERANRDATDLATETELFEASLLMMRHDEEAFDQGF